MPGARPGLWLTLPLVAVMAATAVDAARVLQEPPGGTVDTILEVLLLAALMLAAGAALNTWLAGRARLAQALDDVQRAGREAQAQAEVVAGAGEAIIVIDDQATIVTFNRAAERMFGYSAAEMIGTSLERLMTPRGRQAHAAYLAETGVTAMVEAARMRTVHKGVRKKGDIFTFELNMTEWADDGRRMFTGVMRDVTNREKTADELREANARTAELFEALPNPLFVFAIAGDGDFVLDAMNRAAETAVGLSRFAISGWTPDKLARDEGRALKRALLACVASGETVDTEITFKAGGGARVALDCTPMRNGAGEVSRVLVRLSRGRAPSDGQKSAA